MTIREAILQSTNTIAYQIMLRMTPMYGLQYLEKMRFSSIAPDDIYSTSVGLGGLTYGASPFEMAKAYSTHANLGEYIDNNCVIRIVKQDEGEIFVSCAGGRNTQAKFTFTRQAAPSGSFFLKGSLKGLVGGHSGDDINKKRANAIKLLGRFIFQTMKRYDGVQLAQFHSGKLHNAIPRDGYFVIAVPNDLKENVRADWNVFAAEVEDEFHVTDTQMVFSMESTDAEPVIDPAVAKNFVWAVQAVDNGIYAICQDEALGGMVETSSNIASIHSSDTTIDILSSQRSNVMSNLDNMCATIQAVFELAGAEAKSSDGYPAWKMKADSKLQEIVVNSYVKLFGHKPVVRGIHAGLECGLFSERYPNLDMVSFGPTLRFVHTPDERLHIPTVQMVWDHLLDVLKNIPQK